MPAILPRILLATLATQVLASTLFAGPAVAASSKVVVGHFGETGPRVEFWVLTIDEPTDLQIDGLAYECSGFPEVCTDFFGNGEGNDRIDTVIWIGDGIVADPPTYPYVTGLIDVNDDCSPPCSADGSITGADPYLEVSLAPGQYVVAVEGIGSEAGHYQLTLTAPDTDTLSVARATGLSQRVQGTFWVQGPRVEFWHFSLGEPTTLQIDALAYECSGFPEACQDFFANGVGNDRVDPVIWLGDGIASDPTSHPFVSGLIDVNDDCSLPCGDDGSVSGLDSYLEVDLAPGRYVLAVEGLYGETAGNYQLTFTALGTDTLAISRREGLQIDLGRHFGAPSGAFGGAPGWRGEWNEVGLAGTPLVDAHSWPSAGEVSISALSDDGWAFSPIDDASLLLFDNIFSGIGDPWQVQLTALAHGEYEVYLYAPANGSIETGTMTVNGEFVAAIPGSGSSGALIEGTSWARVDVRVDDGTLTIEGSGTDFSGLAGFQIAPEPGTLPALAAGALVLSALGRRRSRSGY